MSFSTIGILLFRGSIQSNVLSNFSTLKNPNGKPFFEAVTNQVAFIIVLFCHIPFSFYSGKEALCIIVDEF
jgi:hypothetical protein